MPLKGLDDIFYAVLEGSFQAEATEIFEFGLCLVGRGRLYINDSLIIDNGMETNQKLGTSFYGTSDLQEMRLSLRPWLSLPIVVLSMLAQVMVRRKPKEPTNWKVVVYTLLSWSILTHPRRKPKMLAAILAGHSRL